MAKASNRVDSKQFDQKTPLMDPTDNMNELFGIGPRRLLTASNNFDIEYSYVISDTREIS